MTQRFRALLLILGLSLIHSAFAKDWAVYESDHFTIYSDLRETRVRDELEQLEIFGQVAAEFLGIPDSGSRDRVIFFMFDRSVEFNRIQSEERADHFLYQHIDATSAMVDGLDRDQTRHIYVRYLTSRQSHLLYPAWYVEGAAEILKSVEIRNSSITLGRPSERFEFNARLANAVGSNFHPIPVERMIDLNLGNDASNFYPTAWLMAHYLLIDTYDDARKKRQVENYLLSFDAGEDPIAAISESFGMSPVEFDSELSLYGRNRSFRTIQRASMEYGGEISKRDLKEQELFYALGRILIERNQYSSALRYFDDFMDLDELSDLSPRVMSAQAIAYLHQELFDESNAIVDQLIDDNLLDEESLTNLAHYFFDLYLIETDKSDDLRSVLLNQALEYSERAVQQNPSSVEGLYYLGRAHELTGNLSAAAQVLADAAMLSPSEWAVNLALARVLIRTQQTDISPTYISRLYALAGSREVRTLLREVQSQLDDVEFAVDALNSLQ